MYRTIIRRDGFNPLTGRAQYRVVVSYQTEYSKIIFKYGQELWGIVTQNYHQPNSFINPRKALGV